MHQSNTSIIEISIQTFRLLSKKERFGIAKNVVFSVAMALFEVISVTAALPIFFQLISGQRGSQSSFEKLDALTTHLPWHVMLTGIVLIFFIKNIASIWLAQYQSQFLNKLYISFSQQFYENFYLQDWTAYLQKNSSEMFRKIKNTPYDFTNYVLQGYLFLVTDVFICTLMILLMAWINLAILLMLVALSLPVFFLYYFIRKKIVHKIDRSFREFTPQANILLSQGIDSFAEAKMYGKESFFINHFIAIIKITSSNLAKLQSFANLPSRTIESLGILLFAGAVIYARSFPANSTEILIALGLLSVAMYRIVPSANRILLSISQIQAYSYSIAELESEIQINKHSRPATLSMAFEKTIKFNNVSFQYLGARDKQLLHQLSFTIGKGDFVLLEGPSGAGKTTLIHLLSGLIPDYSGEIFIDETALSSATMKAWQRHVALVPQAPIVLQDTILKNIAFGEDVSNIDKQCAQKALELARLDRFVSGLPLQLETPVGENGLTLSGGQRQRLILARALYRKPNLLLLDEVTNQLDEENKVKVLETLKALTSQGTTIILASHDPIVKNFASRVFHIGEATVQELQSNCSVPT